MTGEGEAGERGGPRGSLYVHVVVKPHSLLERHGSDLYCEMLIPFTIAVLGGEAEFPTLDGKVKMKIPAGTPSGKIFRLKGKGMPVIGTNHHGDQLIRVEIEVPAHVSDSERKLLQELAHQRKDSAPTPKKKGFFDHLKDPF